MDLDADKVFDDFDDIDDIEQSEELYEHHRIVIDPGQKIMRIDKFLGTRLANTSRNRIQNAAEAGNILVNGNTVKNSYKVKPNDIISIVLSFPKSEKKLIAQNIPINIVYEDEDIIIVNKEAGMVVHPSYGHYEGTLVNALAYIFNQLPQTDSQEMRPGLVHRIDRYTSGLLVIAKNEIALNKLAKQFFDHTCKRSYIALVWGDLKNSTGTINANVGRSLKNRKVMDCFPDGEHGKRAITHYKVIENLGYVSVVECRLETGRTHQIRVHFKHIGHPLFNDSEYGGNKIVKGTNFSKYKQFVENCFQILPRQALHAKSLGFIHPRTNKEIYFESDIPDDMLNCMNKWRNFSL